MNNTKKLMFAALLMLAFLALTDISIFAQQITATLTGEVRDQAGAVVPGATVTATSRDTGLTKTSTTG